MPAEYYELMTNQAAAGLGPWAHLSTTRLKSLYVKFTGAPGGDTVELRGHPSTGTKEPASTDEGFVVGLVKSSDGTRVAAAAADGFYELPTYAGWYRAKKIGAAGTVDKVTIQGIRSNQDGAN